jgi:DNA-binding response OmpR family regulator
MAQILLVDDDVNSSRLLVDILESEGFEVIASREVAEAAKLIQKREYDIILTDLVLPDASGLELLPLVKMHHPLSEVIVITGYASLESAIKATNDGAAAYIIKPFQVSHLLSRVKKVLEKRNVALKNRELLQELNRVNAELKEKLQQLETLQDSIVEAERLAAVHQVVVTLSHRINNSLAGILGALEVLWQNRQGISGEVEETLRRIGQEAGKIRTIMNNLKELKSLRVIPYLNDITMIDLIL